MPEPQAITLRRDINSNYSTKYSFGVPVIRHAHPDSREVALKKRYKLCFVALDGKGKYFDFERDTLFTIGCQTWWRIDDSNLPNRPVSIIVDLNHAERVGLIRHGDLHYNNLTNAMKRLPSLKSLFLPEIVAMCCEDCQREDMNMEFGWVLDSWEEISNDLRLANRGEATGKVPDVVFQGPVQVLMGLHPEEAEVTLTMTR